VFRSKARAEAELQRLNAADPDERHLYSVRETEVEYSLWEPEVEGVD
jgi:hypothetical protein